MPENTKYTMNHQKRYNKEILDYINYITPNKKLITNIDHIINVLQELFRNKYQK